MTASQHWLRRAYAPLGLLAGVALVVTVVGAFWWWIERLDRRRRAFAELDKIEAYYDYDVLAPDWLRRFVDEARLERTGLFNRFSLMILDGPCVTDSTLAHLEFFGGLEGLEIVDSHVTDAGLAHIGELTSLQQLKLRGADVTDAGILHLRDLVNLTWLDLSETQVGDSGLMSLAKLEWLEHLDLSYTNITDRGMAHLNCLSHLETLNLRGTQVTATGIKPLERLFPELEAIGSQFFLPAIHEAAKRGDVEAIKQEMAEGVSPDLAATSSTVRYGSMTGRGKGMTPLMWAAERCRSDAVRFLISTGADVNAKSSEGLTPLMAAAGAIATIEGHPLSCVRAILKAGAEIDATDDEGHTALHYACGLKYGTDSPPDELLPPAFRIDYPLDRLRPGSGRMRPTKSRRVINARHGDVARVKILLDWGASVSAKDKGGNTPLSLAAFAADAARLRLLIGASGASTSQPEVLWDLLESTVYYGDFVMFRMTLDRMTDQTLHEDQERATGLLVAAAWSPEGAYPKVLALLDRGLDPNAEWKHEISALFAALEAGSEAATALLKAGADPNWLHGGKVKETVFCLTARSGPASALRWLIKRGFDSNVRSDLEPHPTALILAAGSFREAAEKVRLLIEMGADVNATDDKGTTPLLAASREGNMEAVVVLAEAGANVNAVDWPDPSWPTGMTPLHYVANRGDHFSLMCEETGAAAARALLMRGADPHARNVEGLTPRMLAEQIDHQEVLSVLNDRSPKSTAARR